MPRGEDRSRPLPSVTVAEERAVLLDWGDGVADALARGRDFTHCSVLLHEPAADALVLVGQRWGVVRDPGEVVAGRWFVPLEGSVCGWVFRSGSPALVADVRHHVDFRPYPGSQTRSELAVPIILDGRTTGVLNVESARVGHFEIRDVEDVTRHAISAAAGLRRLHRRVAEPHGVPIEEIVPQDAAAG